MILLNELVSYLDNLLQSSTIKDRAVNGLQVEGKEEVHRLILGVSASMALFEAAHKLEADAVLVHHGLLYGTAPQPVRGRLRDRLRLLLGKDISLLGYHLPLDCHEEYSHSRLLARAVGLEDLQPFGRYHGIHLGAMGSYSSPLAPAEVAKRVRNACIQDRNNWPESRADLPGKDILAFGPEKVKQVAIVSGSGSFLLEEAIDQGADLFVTGEGAEGVQEICRETGTHLVAAGHGATEALGLIALGQHLDKIFDLESSFLEIGNPF